MTVSPAVERITQQFDVSSNWFNVLQQLRFAGDSPRIKFFHVKYEGYSDHEPIAVITLEFTPIKQTPPFSWEHEIPYIIIANSAEDLKLQPARPVGYETILTTTALDGRLFELAVVPKPCDRCDGSGEVKVGLADPLDVTTVGQANTNFVAGPAVLKVVCTVCGGRGKFDYA